MKSRKYILLPATVAFAVLSLVAWAAVSPSWSSLGRPSAFSPTAHSPLPDVEGTAKQVDALLHASWSDLAIEPAPVADDLQVFRRLALALVGTTPSLEEIRQFETDTSPNRLQRWTARFIADSRFVEYFAARLADVFVDPAAEDPKPHKRERLERWLGE